jgi:hypothetical protein
MNLRLALLMLALATLLGACAASKSRPKHSLDCRDRIDDCMDDCPLEPAMQDACFAGCRTNTPCD